jgi:hypothetical protein
VLLARTRPVEALLAAVVSAFFLLLVCGYYVPYGGTELGPRFVVPALPFLALGLGPAFARRPRVTALLAIASVLAVSGLTLVWAEHPPIHGTIWGELGRVVTEGRASGLMRHMTPNVFSWSSLGARWGLAVMVAAAAFALALALQRGAWDVRRRPLRAVAAAAVALVLAGGALRIVTKPIDLRASIESSASAAFPGDEVDFTVGVVNRTSEYLPDAVLMIRLPPGTRLLGRPTFERGTGCKGNSTLACDLDFLEGHMQAKVHLGVRIEPSAAAQLAVIAWGRAGDVVGPKTSFTVVTGSA